MAKIERVKLSELVIDPDLYPRSQVDATHVRKMVRALEAGAAIGVDEVFPPLVADRQSKRLVDGVHRRDAVLSFAGADADHPVEWRTYATEIDIFLDMVRLNAGHGKSLSAFDAARCIVIGNRLGVAPELIAASLKMTPERLGQLEMRKTTVAPDGTLTPVRHGASAIGGKEATERQMLGARSSGGMSVGYYANQVSNAVEFDLVDWEHAPTVAAMKRLALAMRAVYQRLREGDQAEAVVPSESAA